MAATEKTRTLEDLYPGQRGTISSVGNKSASVKRRLVDMGLTPGTEILVKKIAPFGDPIEVCLRGYELSIRKEDARQIEMTSAAAERKRKKLPAHTLSRETLMQMNLEHAHEYEEHPARYDHEAHDARRMYIALAGNPNCGKTTLFNALTGSNQYVGNWPGVTVEKKEGTAKIGDREVTIVDLPGIYSLSPYSMEEIVTRDYIIGAGEGEQPPDAIIDIVDATNIERNMYLTIQLLELERPMVVALNFMDEARKAGDEIDVARMSKELGVPVVPISAKTGENLDELLQVAHMQMHVGFNLEPDDLYDEYTHEIHHRVGALIHDRAYAVRLPAHWASIKLLEGDYIVEKALDLDEETKSRVEEIAREYESSSDLGDRETLIADSRYAYIENIVKMSVKKGRAPDAATVSDRIDRIVTHKVFAVPVFLLTMLIVFAITFGPVGSWLSDGVAYLIDSVVAVWLRRGLESLSVAGWLVSLICDGIVSGVGGVLTFLPQIALLFLFLSLLEDGPADAPLRPLGQGVHTDAHGLRLQRAGRHGRPHDGEREGQTHDDNAHPVHELHRKAAGLRTYNVGVLRSVVGARRLLSVRPRPSDGGRIRTDIQKNPVQGRRRGFRSGASAIPDAFVAQHDPPRLGESEGLPREGRNGPASDEHRAVVPPELRYTPAYD